MAPHQQQQQQQNSVFHLDALYCEEEHWEEEETEEEVNVFDDDDDETGMMSKNSSTSNINRNKTPSLSSSVLPLHLLMEQDLFWEDDELISLFSKEQETITHENLINKFHSDPNLAMARREAVIWMMRVNAHYAFSPLTAVLSVNFLDRFLSSLHFQKDKPWMTQLVAVACISIAAKVEETHVPLLLDLQVEETKYVFEAKTIQRMELLILSSLRWRMNPVTPLSFLDHIIRRLGLKNNLHWEFKRRCERLLLSVISDSRFVCYLPSVLAAATMLNVINHVEPSNPIEYQNQLMGVLKINKEKVDECYQLILESTSNYHVQNPNRKRKYESIPGSPNGVIDATFSCDSSNDSWAVAESVSSTPKPLFKKNRVEIQQLRLPPINRVALDVLITSPR